MVKMRGLGRPLAREGREAVQEEPPARRRPTASARRQRRRISVVDDVAAEEVVDVGDIVAPDEGRFDDAEVEASIDAEVEATIDAEVEGFPGGPHDTSVLTLYADHIAAKVWMGEERPQLKLASHGRKVQKFGRPALEIEGLVARTGLSPLITCSLETGDRGLISAFVERWHKETSSFHLPIGEMSITLDDVTSLLHLPVMGTFQTYDVLDVVEAVELLVELLEVTTEEAEAETKLCHGAYVRLSWLRELYVVKCQQMEWIVAARAYLLHLVGCTILANKSGSHIGVVFLEAFRDLDQAGDFSWGAAALQHMYDNLNYACQHHGKQVAGYISLLQCWVYEHFPGLASMVVDEEYLESQPRACRWKAGKALPVVTYRRRLDRLTIDGVSWTPYTDHRDIRGFEVISLFLGHLRWGPYIVRYQPERVLRQFGFVQSIPSLLTLGSPSTEEVDHRWLQYSDFLAVTGDLATFPGQCHGDYFGWFYQISHPFMIPPQPGEPIRRPPVIPDPPPVPQGHVAPAEGHMPQHAVGVCRKIAQRLQQMIDLRMVTAGTDAFDIVDQCITLARSVCDDRIVYVRSRRPRS